MKASSFVPSIKIRSLECWIARCGKPDQEVGLDPKGFEEGMASGKPAKIFEEGRKWGERIKVQYTRPCSSTEY